MQAANHKTSPPAAPEEPRALPVLYAIASLATRDIEPRDALDSILAQLVGVFNATSGSIALLDPDTGQLEVEVQKNMPDEVYDAPLRPGQGITGWVFYHGRARLVSDVRAEPRYIAISPDIRCLMAAPLDDDGRIIGVINLNHSGSGAFGEADLALFVRLAREATGVITRLWQLRQLQGKASQFESLITIGQSLVSKVELRELLASIADDARQITRSHACVLYLHHAGRGCVSLAARSPASGAPADTAGIPLDSSLVASVIHTRRQLDFANVRSPEYRDLLDIPRDEELRSVLASPMIWEGEILGVLAIFTDRVHRFNNDEKRLLNALASLAAVTLQNARLYSRVFQSEALLRKNEQLTTLGLLAAEIAHEIRNPLTVIKLLYGYLGLDFPPTDPRRTDIRVIGEKLDQLEAIVTRVLNFAKAPSSLHSRWPVAGIIDDTIVLIRLKFAQHKVTLRYETPPRHLLVDVHKGQIQQVLLNLFLNAMQAMPDGGFVTVSVHVEEHAPPASGAPGVQPARALHIDIGDSGPGIPQHVRAHVFDSFLSGRPDGTGLGLAIAKRIMLGHHGDIVILDTGATGTTFRLTLPLAG